MTKTLASSLALAVALAVAGCGASGLRTQASAATVASIALETAGQTVDHARRTRLDMVESRVSESPDRDEILRREAARWEPVGAALDACRDALLTWVEALNLARLGDEGLLSWEVFVPLVMRLVLLYDDVARLATELGVSVPPLPDLVRALASAPEGR